MSSSCFLTRHFSQRSLCKSLGQFNFVLIHFEWTRVAKRQLAGLASRVIIDRLAAQKVFRLPATKWLRGDATEYESEVVTPQDTRCETFSKAELKSLMTEESVRTSVEQRLVRLVVGDKG